MILQKILPFLKAYKWYILAFSCVILFIVIIIVNLLQTSNEKTTRKTSVLPTIYVSQVESPVRLTHPGYSVGKDVENLPTFESKTILSDGQTEYKFQSEIVLRPDIALTNNEGIVIFERHPFPKEKDPVFSNLTSVESKYGKADAIIDGAEFYDQAQTYVYASHGFSVIVSPFTKNVFEVQFYRPTTEEQYRKQFGNNIKLNTGPHGEQTPDY